MKKKTAILTLAAFAAFSTSCTTWGTRHVNTTADCPKPKAKILTVDTSSGGSYLFSKSDPGRIIGNSIVGLAIEKVEERVEIRGPFRLVHKSGDGSVDEVVDKDGKTFSVGRVLSEDAGTLIVLLCDTTPSRVSIPLSEVNVVRFKRANWPLTVVSLAPLAVVGFYTIAFIFSDF